ncbi:prephenate dehydrogenase [Membranicola marinus]|uniref:Prephenate dehydrogenase n=1 Tax=Membranihabitans marinus TaxID=1227546 RepID=A0A953HME3_9BACT|nr:prephenate dehydrogenase [Membranihabitans marinus]MBY5958312.1 prephenate dehydrogenase [Membranihabitans marinus]
MKVGIIGLGLIGGSMGLALRECNYASRVYGYDQLEVHVEVALQKGIVDEGCDSLEKLVQASDVVILAVPVQSIVRLLPQVLDLVDQEMVIDVGSTKQDMVESVKGHPKRSRYLPTHPMAGTEYSGPQAALQRLFEGKVCVFCDVEDSDKEVVDEILTMYERIGMDVVEYHSAEHDVHTAYVSHISHISSIALALTVLEKEKNENRIFELASGGFSSTVRLAKSNPDTWIPIFEQNRDNVLDVLDEHINVISQFRTMLIKKDFERFHALMERANDIKKILK